MSMFRICPAPTFRATVQLTVPGADAKAPISIVFAHKGKKALLEWIGIGRDVAQDRGDPEFLGEVVKGWSGVLGPDGHEVPFSAEAFAALLDAYPASGTEIYTAYTQAFYEARAKN